MTSFELKELENNYKGMESLIPDLVKSVLTYVPEQVIELENFIQIKNQTGITNGAHKLKGSLSTIFATRGIALCKTLEMIARNGNLQESDSIFQKLKAELQLLDSELKQYLQSLQGQ